VCSRAPEDERVIGTVLGLLGAVALIAANGFFVAAEFALVAVDRTRVEQVAASGSRRADICLGLLARLSHHLSGAQLGITVTSIMLGFIAEPAIATAIQPLLEPVVGEGGGEGVAIVLAISLATVAQMVLGELVPKTYAISRPLPSVLALAPGVRAYDLVFGWLIRLLDRAANGTVRRLGIEPVEELSAVRSLPELELLFQTSAEHGILDRRSTGLLRRSIRFGEKTAADALVPRTAMVAIPVDARAADLVELARRTGRSRFPVFGADLDDIRGVVHVKAVLGLAVRDRATCEVATLLTPAVFVPETRPLDDLLVDIQASRTHLVLVVDEYGGTAGLLTLEDVLEEIVGEIADEYDLGEPQPTHPSAPGSWVLSGSLHPDEVLDACGFEVPEGDYETLAGFVVARLGAIPDTPGATVEFEGWHVEVTRMDRLRVAEVRVDAPPVPRGSGADGAGSP
jgi:CBS domain containing-hemolysin-like protein